MIMEGKSAEEVIKIIDERTYRNFGEKHKKESEALRARLSGESGQSTDSTEKPEGGAE